MTQLIIQEAETQPSSSYKIADIDRKLERALDNQIYEKYRRLTELQALKTTMQSSEKRLKRLLEEDVDLLKMIKYVYDKGKVLQAT